ncbi:arylsulfatase [Aeoliella sp. ICT_H6.2]|uniref:Arylsulfatase n=1 Tax=Aeoliella straminimaris TaxID=2954799 RepID=A0A9X2F5Z8_9BACT|nr:arylsulfatase [Aeoliella straminimaris]MCO6042333.1 arylsulfatase [Aeoliella straminimaris]
MTNISSSRLVSLPTWLCLLVLVVGLQLDSVGIAAESHPNIVLIVSDDQGWNDVGYHNSEIKSPTLDRLASEGVRFDWHYVMPQCTPTRVCLMTGRYPSRFGNHCCLASNSHAFDFDTPTLASVLREAGYETALCGKWHLGSKPEWGPNHHGFDHSYGSLAGAVGMLDHRYRLGTSFTKTWHRNHEFVEEQGHATDLVTAEAVKLLKADRDQPLFLYVPFHAVHTPLVEEEKWLAQNTHIESADRRLYAAAVTHLDDCVRRIVEATEDMPNGRDTLVVFVSDNGAVINHGGNAYPPPDPKLRNFSSNAPLRSSKTHVYEGGIRVPAFAYWPGHLEPSVCDAPLHAVDWMPTLATLAGADLPDDTTLDGQDIWPQLNGQPASDRELYWVWGSKRNRVALRAGDWKVLRDGPNQEWKLYNLKDDPYEKDNRASAEPERLEQMLDKVRQQKTGDAS